MPISSAIIDATLRALHGEADLNTVSPALNDWMMAQIIALTPNAHPVLRALAALRCGLTDLLDTHIIGSPDLHAALWRIMEASAGYSILASWAEIAPSGWGNNHAHLLINAVKKLLCRPNTAAALIGPGDTSARLLRTPADIAFAIRRWGQSLPDDPTSWMDALSAAERYRLINEVQREPSLVAFCLPWLPPEATHIETRIENAPGDGLAAFARASPVARAQGAALVQRLVAQAQPTHLGALTLLACAMKSEEIWTRALTLIRSAPDSAYHVVIAAPWNDVQDDVRAAILEQSDQSDICAAVAVARGRARHITLRGNTVAACFAALDPKVWDALPAAEQRQWRDALPNHATHLAVRSLGLRPEFLVQAHIDNDLVHAMRKHIRDAAMLQHALLPVALRDIPPKEAYALISALPTLPPDPSIFFAIASRHADPSIIRSAQSALHTPPLLARAIVLQRSIDRRTSIRARCDGLQEALRGQTQDDLAPILPLLTKSARTMCMTTSSVIIRRLAHLDRRAALRQTLDRLARLPPEVVIPTYVALKQLTSRNTSDAAEVIAHTLRTDGDAFLDIVDACAGDDLHVALLPLPKNTALAYALRALARDDPPIAQRLAHAMHDGDWRTALHVLQHTPPHDTVAIWQALDADTRRAIVDEIIRSAQNNAPIVIPNSIAALMRAEWDELPCETQQVLHTHPAFTDLPHNPNRLAIHSGRRR